MNMEIIYTLIVIVLAIFFFVTEYVPLDVVAISIIVVLVLTGVITAEQGLEGFANQATITVAAMFILSHAIIKTNIIDAVHTYFKRMLDWKYPNTILGIGLSVGGISAFINNTPIVAALIPSVSDAAKEKGISPARFLIPLSFAAIFGGSCTLIGTSTNLLVSSIARENGLPGFSIFLFAPLGLVFMAIGILYLMLFGKSLIAERRSEKDIEDDRKVENYLLEVKLKKMPEGDATIKNVFNPTEKSIDILRIKRANHIENKPSWSFELQQDDIVLLKGNMHQIIDIVEDDAFSTTGDNELAFPEEGTRLIEIVLLPNSPYVGRSPESIANDRRFHANVLAIKQRGKERFKDFGKLKLHAGDVLLLQANQQGALQLHATENDKPAPFMSIRKLGIESTNVRHTIITIITLFAVIGLAAVGLVPIAISALAGVVVLNIAGVITMGEAYKAVDWKVIFLLAGALSLGTAMNESGISALIGAWLVGLADAQLRPVLIVSLLYITTSICTELMSNNAAAALLAPIGISVASAMDISATPLLLAIAFAGSASFMTPVGYQTNTMVYNAGSYKFRDFVKVGAPLNLLFWLAASILIPVFYPF